MDSLPAVRGLSSLDEAVPHVLAEYCAATSDMVNLPFRIHVPVVALLAGGLLVWAFLRYEAKSAEESGAVIQQAQQALDLGHRFRARNAALAERAKTALQAARNAQQAINGLRERLQQAPTVRDTVRIQTILVDSLTTQRDSLTIAEAYQRARAERAESRVTLLESNLRSTLTVADCHIAGLKWLPRCASRMTSLVLGLGTGALAVLVLHH